MIGAWRRRIYAEGSRAGINSMAEVDVRAIRAALALPDAEMRAALEVYVERLANPENGPV